MGNDPDHPQDGGLDLGFIGEGDEVALAGDHLDLDAGDVPAGEVGVGGIDEVILGALEIEDRDMDVPPQGEHFGKFGGVVEFFGIGGLEHPGDKPAKDGVFYGGGKPKYLFLPGGDGGGDEDYAVDKIGVVHGEPGSDGGAKAGADEDNGVMEGVYAIQEGTQQQGLFPDIGFGVAETGVAIPRPVDGIHTGAGEKGAVLQVVPPISEGTGGAMDKKNGAGGILTNTQVTQSSPPGCIIADVGVEVHGMELFVDVPVVQAKLYKLVKDEE
jgi:hypothetical protein